MKFCRGANGAEEIRLRLLKHRASGRAKNDNPANETRIANNVSNVVCF
eukprot:CAMPEP_0185822614 /NCGR_PEP_ID=MMETSP1322-20130828/27016_1 /TAXON_ID=265543 /ORGANISM="Minutocellus polymorphus, Strain RCC2270" /LENGTH=47 /DNA_ID= /DNA_START= /DNA_END= /DNA_ORIENTATION=